jgi:hypothetical protein
MEDLIAVFPSDFFPRRQLVLKGRQGSFSLARYKDALDRLGERNVIMWLVAPQISNSVREFLDRIGIEYTEIHESEFRRVADRHGITTQAGAGVSGDANPAPEYDVREC